MRSIDDIEVTGRRTFVRVDLNVPVRDGRVSDATRIEASLPTVRALSERGARVLLAAHLGRPKGKPEAQSSLAPVAAVLAERLGRPIALLPDCVGEVVERHVRAMADGDVVLLENLRFHAGEEANDAAFAAALARLCEVYVNDAFGTAHRAHASTAGMVPLVQTAAAGYLMLGEVRALRRLLESPAKPFVAIVGGAKVSDKIAVMSNLLERISTLVVGGAMAYTFLKAQGHEVGTSRVETDRLELATKLLAEAAERDVRIELPVDHVVAAEFRQDAQPFVTEGVAIDAGKMGLDIGPRSRTRYAGVISGASTVFWNGPMGVFEWPAFSAGTMAIANAVADSRAWSVVGGGDSVAALAQSGRSDAIGHISTGGGASLELLEGRTLPGLAALEAHEGR